MGVGCCFISGMLEKFSAMLKEAEGEVVGDSMKARFEVKVQKIRVVC